MRIPRDYEERVEFTKSLLKDKGADYAPLESKLTPEQVEHNIENFVGDVKVPLAIAGPIIIHGKYAQGEFYVPMATTEGAIVASYSRGMKLMNACGGCETLLIEDYFIRGGCFVMASLEKGERLREWCIGHKDDIENVINKCSSHISMKDMTFEFVGREVLISYKFETGDAMGSNMSSKACAEATKFIHEKAGLSERIYFPIPEDKKHLPLRQKGKKVVARCRIEQRELKDILHTDIKTMYQFTNIYKNALVRFGTYSLNMQAGNAIAGMFLALGQDLAYLGECSQVMGDITFIDDNQAEACVTLPSLIVGTVGGGTGLPCFKTCLKMIDCYGTGGAKKLAEIIAATVLAGELSCCASHCAEDFIHAHEAMGKNRPEPFASPSI